MKTPDLGALSDLDLIESEERLQTLFTKQVAADYDTARVEAAHDYLAKEMRERGLFYLPLAKKKGKKSKKWDQADANDKFAVGDQDSDQKGNAPSEARAPSERQDPKPNTSAPQKPEGGPWAGAAKTGKGGETNRTQDSVGKAKTVSGSPWTTTGMKSGKGGNANRTQRGVGSGKVGRAKNGGLGASASTPYPSAGRGVKTGKGGERNRGIRSVGKAKIVLTEEEFDKAFAKGKATPHPFVPVRNICRLCRQGQETHVSKYIGEDKSWKASAALVRKASKDMQQAAATGVTPNPDPTDPDDTPGPAQSVNQASETDRAQGAQNGQALPDGSFYIPDEAALHQAVRLVGQAQDPQAAMNHIIERAKAMGLTTALPPAWNVPDAGMEQGPLVGPGARAMAPKAGPGNGSGSGSAGGKPGAGLMKRIAKAVGRAMGAEFNEDMFADQVYMEMDEAFEYAVIKSVDEKRYTLGPVYMPGVLDAHGEWATAEDLQKSTWDYVRDTGADRTVYLQHSDKPAGEWVEIMAWPQPVTASMVGGVRKGVEDVVLPAGTVYMGVRWNKWAWEDVKKGKITGFSMGGYAQRVEGVPA